MSVVTIGKGKLKASQGGFTFICFGFNIISYFHQSPSSTPSSTQRSSQSSQNTSPSSNGLAGIDGLGGLGMFSNSGNLQQMSQQVCS